MRAQSRAGAARQAAHRRWLAALALAAVVGIIVAGVLSHRRSTALPRTNDVRAWAPPGTKPLTDAQAAALITPDRETVPGNSKANAYVPTNGELSRFHAARSPDGRTSAEQNPLTRYVTGRPGLRSPSTDELIQWVSHKWGIPTDWIRAQLVLESHWRQSQQGDSASVPPRWYGRYPAFARQGGERVQQSLGIAQVKWIPDGSVGAGTEPLRWRSTAFNLDYYAATVRFYYDGDCHWCKPGYSAGQGWNSLGAWYWPTPWASPQAAAYVHELRQALRSHAWERL